MHEEKLRKEIYKIINRETYGEGKIIYPTKKDLKRNPDMHPGFIHAVKGKHRAARKITELLHNNSS